MTTIPQLTIDLQKALTVIRSLHGPQDRDGLPHCEECQVPWPCHTYSLALLQHRDGYLNIDGASQHLEGRLSALPSVLRVAEDRLSRLRSDVAEDVISAIHHLCVVDGLAVSAAINGSGYAEIQFALSHPEGSSPLWSLAFMSRFTLRVFGPTPELDDSKFHQQLISRSFGDLDSDEIQTWWATLNHDKHSYFTTHIVGTDEEVCRALLDMCDLTHRFTRSSFFASSDD